MAQNLQKNNLDNHIKLAAKVSVVVNTLVFLAKIYSYIITQSAAVLSDAMEGIVNVLASFIALGLVRYAAKPADEDHPYGHGKAEYISSAFEGGMIFFAAVVIILFSAQALFEGPTVKDLDVGLIWVAGTTLVNLALGVYLLKVGRRYHSDAMAASGHHVLSDVYTTLGVLIGLVIVWLTGLTWVDPVIAIVVGLQLAYSGFKIFLKSTGSLLDKQEPEDFEQLVNLFNRSRLEGIIDIHNLRMIRSGRFHHVDAHVVVPCFWSVEQAHDVTVDFETKVVSDYEFDGEIAFHLDPCKKSYCVGCSVRNCAIRGEEFGGLQEFTAKSLTQGAPATN